MKKYQFKIFVPLLSIVVIALVLSSCAAGVPARKKLPGYLQYDAFEIENPFNTKIKPAGSEYGFAYSETNIIGNDGRIQECVTVPLPDASYDAIAISLFESYKTLAMPLLAEWAKQSRNGVVLDLRSNETNTGSRSDYALQKSGEFTIPVIFVWDETSKERATTFIQLLQGLPGISFNKVS